MKALQPNPIKKKHQNVQTNKSQQAKPGTLNKNYFI